MTEDIVECYCDDEEDDGTMMFCEKCHKWQHAICVNWNDFTAPAKYMCPTCQGFQVDCICQTETDFQHAIIQCSKCHLYQHKRHVGFGIGKNPPYYICSKCSPTYTGGRNLKIEPNLYFFPSFNEKLIPLNINSFPYSIPTGKLLSKLKEHSLGNPITPVNLACSMLISFRDILFKSHPTLKYFDYIKYYPERNVKDACQFMFYLAKTLSYMCDISTPEMMQIFDHIVTLMIYKRAIPKSFRSPVGVDCEDEALIVGMSDRAQDVIRSNYKMIYFPRPHENIPLKVVAGRNSFPTVISLVDVRECDFICRLWGYCMDFEEIDQPNHVPDFSIFNVSRSKLFVNSSRVDNHPIFLHIRRGLVSNCEVRLFRTTLRGSKKKVICAGIFATKPTIMQHLIDAKPSTDSISINNSNSKLSSYSESKNESDGDDDYENDNFQQNDNELDDRSKKGNRDRYVISAGEELVLPFDLAPLFIRNDAEWRTGPVDPRLVNIDNEIDINSFKPLRPANSNAVADDLPNPTVNELSAKVAFKQQQHLKIDTTVEVEPKEQRSNETTMQNLFSKNAPLNLDFHIESDKKKSSSNSTTNSDGESGINSDSDEQFQITSKSELYDLFNSKNDKKDQNPENSNDEKNENETKSFNSNPQLKKRKLLPSLARSDPLQGPKSWYQPVMQYEEKIPEMKLKFREQWNPISPALPFKRKDKPSVTPAEFWSEDPIDFVDVSDSDLK